MLRILATRFVALTLKKSISLLLISSISVFALNINTATKAEFVKVKGIGAKKAERIIAYRDKHGKFNSIEELKNVKGIGSKIVAVIKAEEGK